MRIEDKHNENMWILRIICTYEFFYNKCTIFEKYLNEIINENYTILLENDLEGICLGKKL